MVTFMSNALNRIRLRGLEASLDGRPQTTTQLKPINVSLEENVSAPTCLLQRDPSGALQQVVYCYFKLTSIINFLRYRKSRYWCVAVNSVGIQSM